MFKNRSYNICYLFSLPKVNMADIIKKPMDLSDVQDFSTKKQSHMDSSHTKGKLDDMLTKLMKKNNVNIAFFFIL